MGFSHSICDKIYVHVDPLNPPMKPTGQMFSNFKTIKFTAPTAHLLGNLTEWSFQSFYHGQIDGDSCGVICLYYVKEFLKRNELKCVLKFDIVTYRSKIAQKLLENSSPMLNNCLYSGRKVSNLDWCQCDICKRWVHINCLHYLIYAMQSLHVFCTNN